MYTVVVFSYTNNRNSKDNQNSRLLPWCSTGTKHDLLVSMIVSDIVQFKFLLWIIDLKYSYKQ